MDYKTAYEYGVQSLQEVKIEEARLDARLLLEYSCHTTRHDLLVHGDRILSLSEEENYKQCVNARKGRKPLQYIIGFQEFMGLDFMVNEAVLIPRQDTEILVEEAMKKLHDGMEILDVCTGSGCILLSLLHYSNDCRGVGIDISKEALEVARQNGEKHELEAEWLVSDLLENLDGKFDLMVSNPPYIPTEVIADLMPEVREFEPFGALDGKEDGLFFYRKLIEQSTDHLRIGGFLLLEIGDTQAEAVSTLLEQAGYVEIEVKKDLAGRYRVVIGSYKGA